jgi:hypothetical protein
MRWTTERAFEAVINDTLPQYYANRLYIFSLCSDELPATLVGPWHPDYPLWGLE